MTHRLFTSHVHIYVSSELRSCVKAGSVRPGLPVPNSPYGLCGREATLNSHIYLRARVTRLSYQCGSFSPMTSWKLTSPSRPCQLSPCCTEPYRRHNQPPSPPPVLSSLQTTIVIISNIYTTSSASLPTPSSSPATSTQPHHHK